MKWLVYGLGESGSNAALALLRRGHQVTVTASGDGAAVRAAAEKLGVEAQSGARPEVLDEGFDRIVVSPGIRPRDSLLRAAEANPRVHVMSEVALGLDLLAAEAPGTKIVAVTGTNGKTTVADMISQMLSASGVAHAVAGNSWRALTGCLDEVEGAGTLVLEISSFQLHYLENPGFEVAALLNVRPDHLNWHADFEEYVADKLRIFQGQSREDLALFSATDPVGVGFASGAEAQVLAVGADDTCVSNGQLLLRGRSVGEVSSLRLVGRHNHENALFAAAAAERIGATLVGIREALAVYEPKRHRMQAVGERGGVAYVDDSKATNPAAVAAALAGLNGTIVLILGGSEKHTDFSEVVPELHRCRLVLCQGEAGPRIKRFLSDCGLGSRTRLVPDLAAAVEVARSVSRPGDTVLLSPGCASFDQFEGYEERGDVFAELAMRDVGTRIGGAGARI